MIRIRYSRHCMEVKSYTELVHKVFIMDLLSSAADENSRLRNPALKVLSSGIYKLLPSAVQYIIL